MREEMGTVYGGDPPLRIECIGCDFAHPPGMLCREQRTALTTARARSETKRDLGQVALRLGASSQQPSDLPNRKSRAPCCHNLSNSPFGYSDSLLDSSLVSGQYPLDGCGSTTSGDCKDNCNCCPSRKSSRSHMTSRKNLNRRNACYHVPKLSEVFVWLCLLSLMHPTCTRAAPTRSSPKPSALKTMERQNGAALWINPCGMGASDDNMMPQDIEIPYVSDKELLNQIVVQAKNALAEADSFKVDYVKKTFKADFTEHHNSWKQNHYDWLPSKKDIPKDLGEDISMEHFQAIENNLDLTLANSYEYLQRFAVGLEQVASDQRSNSAPYKDLFTKAEYKLRAVLCEIQVAIIERNVDRRPDITREIMSEEFRTLDDSYRNLRDWLIYRDYMNALEYIIKVFEFYGSKMT